MRLPFADNAYVDLRKFTEYLLSKEHGDGRHKARLWAGAFDIGIDAASELVTLILRSVGEGDASWGRFDRRGQCYTVDFILEWREFAGEIRTGWIVEHGSEIPRLTTAFPK